MSQTIREMNNCQLHGLPVLVPSVQNYAPQSGAFAIPQVLTVSVPPEEQVVVELLDNALRRWNNCQALPSPNAVCRFFISEQDTPAHPEGYVLAVSEHDITIKARTNAGLFYGAQTLCNLLRNASQPSLACCRIQDWPDFDRRGYFFTIRGLPPSKLPELKKTLDVLASLKLNWLCLELAEAFPYEHNELTKRPNAFTREQLEDLRNFCRSRHLEITPTLQVLSHNLWMTYHPDWGKMREADVSHLWSSQSCLSNQQAKELTQRTIQEQLDFFKPEVFFLMMDEIRYEQIKQCPVCGAQDIAKLLGDYINAMEDTVKAAGARPMICHDSFEHRSSTLPCANDVRNRLDKNDMILWWSYQDHLNENNLKPFKDFQLVGHALHGKPDNVRNMCRLIKKYGGRDCTVVYWYFSTMGTLANLPQETPDSLGGFVNSCDYMWRFDDADYADFPYDAVHEMMRRLHPEMLPPQRQEKQAAAVPLENSVNADLAQDAHFPRLTEPQITELQKTLSGLPEHFRLITSPGGHYYGLRVSGSRSMSNPRYAIRSSLDGRKTSRLSFLFTTSRPDNVTDYLSVAVYGRKRFTCEPAAQLTLEYTDGTTTSVPLRYHYELNEWNRPFSGFTTRTAVRGLDADNRYFSFNIFELVNPHPEKPLRSFVFGSQFLDGISPACLAVSAWDVDKPFEISPSPLTIKQPYPVSAQIAPKLHFIQTFENGLGNCRITTDGNFTTPIKAEIVEDLTAPGDDKTVMKLTVPTATLNIANHSGGCIRFNLDIPCKISPETQMLTLALRMAPLDGFSRCQDYLVAADNATHRFYRQSVSEDWTVNYAPLSFKSLSQPFLEDIPRQTVLRRISFFFNSLDTPVVLYIKDIGDSPDLLLNTQYWTKSHPVE